MIRPGLALLAALVASVAHVVALPTGAAAEPVAASAPALSGYTAVTPVRVLDTRTGVGKVAAGATVTVDLSDRLPATATAVALTVTGLAASAATTVTAYRAGTARPDTAAVSLHTGESRSGSVTVQVGPDRKVDLTHATGSLDLVADLSGYYATGSGAKYRPTPSAELFDLAIGAAATRTVDLSARVPAGATAVAITLTGGQTTAPTSVTAWRTGTARPGTSVLTTAARRTASNLAVVALGADRKVDLFNEAGTVRVIGQLAGYYGADATGAFVPVPPRRVLDTTTGLGVPSGPVAAGGYLAFDATVGAPSLPITGVVANLTGAQGTGTARFGMAQDWSGDYPARTLFVEAARTATTQVFAPLFDRQVRLKNLGTSGAAHLLGDVTGYFVGTCAGDTGCVFAWGQGQNGQLGDGSSGYRADPGAIPGFGDVVAIAAGSAENLALRADGTVWAWGYSSAVPGHRSERPARVPGLSGITAVAAGASNGLALGSDGTVWSWGSTGMGQIGDGVDYESDHQTTPVRVAGLTGVVDIAVGQHNSYAVKSDGTVWSWGYNFLSRLGNGVACDQDVPGTCSSNVPVQVVGMTDAVAVSAEGFALKSDGTAWVWGSNAYGLLGTGSTDNLEESLVAIQVPGLTDVVEIDGSNANRYARKADGTVVAWGSNANGQIGNGSTSTAHVRTPTPVSGLTGVVDIASGEAHNGYALTSDGTVWAWGYNWNHQLGTPTPASSNVPLRVAGVSGIGVTRIAGYAYGALALVPTG
ncbi:RCC1 domain-containing protein [Saccharothrix luteola]|uniref:RCC1 domain-containing protein n=1 Tax=Saccharothrix luteola TaxID=2893018 RepID=UPI001E387688|nr:hypothetical protein [Saccharothrix luteola]MCC8246764.1 hypothetical protein [Saccharothrix luteola]